jgi:hypothetical protein
LLDGCIESVAVNVHNVLRQVARKLKLSKQIVSCPELPCEIQRLEVALLGEDGFDFGSQRLVPCFLVTEEFGALGCIVDDFRDL